MALATWNGVVLAESDKTVIVEGNHYFPPQSLKVEHFSENNSTTVCPWKGLANYMDITVAGKTNVGAAWVYHEPNNAASNIKDYVAFWRGVQVES